MRSAIAAAVLLFTTPAAAEVVKAGDHGFELSFAQTVPGAPDAAMAAFANVGRWWDGEHTYSGSAANMGIQLKPGGCFCETLPTGGGIEHMRVVYVDPGKRLVMTGGLGPLLYDATAAVMDVRFKAEGEGTSVIVSYKAAGFANGGAAARAPLVNGVLAGQLSRYAAHAAAPGQAR